MVVDKLCHPYHRGLKEGLQREKLLCCTTYIAINVLQKTTLLVIIVQVVCCMGKLHKCFFLSAV